MSKHYLQSRYHFLANEVGGTVNQDETDVIHSVNGELRHNHYDGNLGNGGRWLKTHGETQEDW